MINTFENICIEKDKGYFFSFEINGLYELNLKNWKCKFLTAYDKLNDERLFSNIVKYKDWLVLIPMQADKFMLKVCKFIFCSITHPLSSVYI